MFSTDNPHRSAGSVFNILCLSRATPCYPAFGFVLYNTGLTSTITHYYICAQFSYLSFTNTFPKRFVFYILLHTWYCTCVFYPTICSVGSHELYVQYMTGAKVGGLLPFSLPRLGHSAQWLCTSPISGVKLFSGWCNVKNHESHDGAYGKHQNAKIPTSK